MSEWVRVLIAVPLTLYFLLALLGLGRQWKSAFGFGKPEDYRLGILGDWAYRISVFVGLVFLVMRFLGRGPL